MVLRSCWTGVRRWVNLGTEWVERMWVRDDRGTGQRGAGEHRWTWIWLGQDATDADIDEVVRQVHEQGLKLPVPLGIGECMLTVSAWGPRRDGVGEQAYLEARQAGREADVEADLAQRERPKVIPLGDLARGNVIDRSAWMSGRVREQLRRTLQLYRPSRQWRIVQISLFSVGEAYLKLVACPN